MHLRAPAVVLSARQHGETAVVARLLTEESGVIAGYVAGGRGRQLRPVVIPGNLVEAELRSRSDAQLPFAKLELVESRGPWLSEPLPAAAIGWACALTATALPERHAYPALWQDADIAQFTRNRHRLARTACLPCAVAGAHRAALGDLPCAFRARLGARAGRL